MNNDIYWTTICLKGLKMCDESIFDYSLSYIIDDERKKKLMNIKALVGNEDVETCDVLNKLTLDDIPIIVA